MCHTYLVVLLCAYLEYQTDGVRTILARTVDYGAIPWC